MFGVAARCFVAVTVLGTKLPVSAVDDEIHAPSFSRAPASDDGRALRPTARDGAVKFALPPAALRLHDALLSSVVSPTVASDGEAPDADSLPTGTLGCSVGAGGSEPPCSGGAATAAVRPENSTRRSRFQA